MSAAPDELTIRPMRPAEEPRFVARIVETAWHDLLPYQRERTTRAELEPGIRRVVESIRAHGENRFLIADLPGRDNVGQLWLGRARDPNSGAQRGYVYILYVEPDARRRGVARALMAEAERISRARGDGELALSVAAPNLGAQALYRALGFEIERLSLSKPLELP